MWRRLPASNSTLSGPACSIRGGSVGSSVPNSRIESESMFGLDVGRGSMRKSSGGKEAFNQNRGNDNCANRRPLPKGRYVQKVQTVPDHDHNENTNQRSDNSSTSAV